MKSRALSLALLLSLLAAAGCGGPKKDVATAAATPVATPAPAPLPADLKDVAGLTATPTPASSAASAAGSEPEAGATPGSVVATGEFVAPVRSELAVRMPGRVGQVFVDEGNKVQKGQPLLRLETQYLELDLKRTEADVARAKATADDAERDFKRKQELLAKDSVAKAAYDRSQTTFASAKAATQSAEAARDLAKQHLDDAVLRSPITGVIAEKRTDVGERMGDASVAFVVVQTSPIKLRFRLPERYLANVRNGQIVRASVDPYPGEVFQGRVTQVGGVIDSATRTVAVETEMPNRDGRLSPGLFARVEIDVKGGAR
ncbi:MAG TPA: efflux RND transporter periplasmic adaptor subunit [Thermoanaerobaculia bacterium]|jgi:RND family efflux transporter MFP subunit|nr:efflux RND transporter periplasmic adaptor subunit [Thermoanaerobaculia bacterium]